MNTEKCKLTEAGTTLGEGTRVHCRHSGLEKTRRQTQVIS